MLRIANDTARALPVQNKAVVMKAQAVAAAAWAGRIEAPVQSFRGWELANNLMRLAYMVTANAR